MYVLYQIAPGIQVLQNTWSISMECPPYSMWTRDPLDSKGVVGLGLKQWNPLAKSCIMSSNGRQPQECRNSLLKVWLKDSSEEVLWKDGVPSVRMQYIYQVRGPFGAVPQKENCVVQDPRYRSKNFSIYQHWQWLTKIFLLLSLQLWFLWRHSQSLSLATS